jgi:hypothetical protein
MKKKIPNDFLLKSLIFMCVYGAIPKKYLLNLVRYMERKRPIHLTYLNTYFND